MDFIDATYTPQKEAQTQQIIKQYEGKLNTLMEIEGSQRPGEIDVFGNAIFGYDSNMYAGFRGNNLYELYWLWVLSDVTTTISNVLTRKVFRGGIKYTPKINDTVDKQETKIKQFIRCCNSDNQSYKEVLEEIYDDLNWADVGVQLNLKDYYINSQGKIVGGEIREVLRINPINVLEIKDTKTYELGIQGGKQQYTKISNRSVKTTDVYDKVTNLPNIPIHYAIRTNGGEKYYNKSELIIKHKFKKKSGFSPLHSTKNKILTLMEMDYYIKKEYSEGKPSKKMLAFKTQDRNNMKEAYKDYEEKIKRNPNGLFPLIIQSPPDNRQPLAEVIDFMRPLNEMQYNEMRQRYITDIGAVWGTSPMFHNDMSTGGGLNNEGLQMTVTNEVVEADKSLIEEYYIEPTFEQLGLDLTYDISLYPNKEEDIMFKEQLFTQQLQNVKEYVSLGGEVSYREGSFVFKENDFNQDKVQEEEFNNFNEEELQLSKGLKENIEITNLSPTDKKVETVNINEEINDYVKAIEQEMLKVNNNQDK